MPRDVRPTRFANIRQINLVAPSLHAGLANKTFPFAHMNMTLPSRRAALVVPISMAALKCLQLLRGVCRVSSSCWRSCRRYEREVLTASVPCFNAGAGLGGEEAGSLAVPLDANIDHLSTDSHA